MRNVLQMTTLVTESQSEPSLMENVFTLRDGATDVMSILVGRVVWAVSIVRHCSTDQTYKKGRQS